MKSTPYKLPRWVVRSVGPVVIALIAFAAFIPALSADYSDFDDVGTLVITQMYRGLELENIRWMFTTTVLGHYQPLAWLTFALEWVIVGGMNPAVSHSINLVVHSINAALVCLLARRLIALARPSLSASAVEAGAVFGALLFAVHPLRVESVAWVTERRDVLSLMFYLLTLLAYLRAYPPGSTKPVTTGRAFVVFLCFILSLLAKAWGMTFFLVLLTLDWFPLRRLPWPGVSWLKAEYRPILLQKLPFAVIGVGWVFVAGLAASSMPGTSLTLAKWGIVDRLCQASYGVMFYLWKMIWPRNLAALYEIPDSMSPTEPRVIAGFVCVGIIIVGVFVLRRRAPALVAAVLAYVFIVSPVLGLFQSGIQLVADRYSYISMIGLEIVVGAAAAELCWRFRPSGRVIAAVVGALLIGTLATRSWIQSRLWQSTEALFAHAFAIGEHGPIVRANYGQELNGRGAHQEAIDQFRQALALKPDYGEAWLKLANTFNDLDRVPEAEEAYRRAQETLPDSWRADIALGLMYAEKKDDLETGLRLFQSAVDKIEGPENWVFSPNPYLLLAQALYDSGDTQGAKRELLKAVQFRETHEKAVAALKLIAKGR